MAARRPDRATVLLGLREAAQARKGTRKRGTLTLTRAQRVALAPKAPRGQAVQYMVVLEAFLGSFQDTIRKVIFPALPELVRARTGVQSLPDDVNAQVGVRRDCCGCVVPGWLHAIHMDAAQPRAVPFRGPWRIRDTNGDAYSQRLGQLEVALTEAARDPRLVASLEDIARGVDRHNRAEMTRILTVDLRNDPSLRVYIDRFVQDNTRLIQSVGASQLQRMEGIISSATSGQTRVEDLQDRIMESFSVSQSRAALIARDQTLKANAQLTQLRQQRVGVTDYIWTTTKDERVRGRPGGKWEDSHSDHWVLDGTRQTWLVAPVTDPVTGVQNHPGEDFQCRCIAFPVVDNLLDGL